MPEALDNQGGWLNRDSADWFADYAATMYQALDGRVKRWATLNEPWVVTDGGYLHGALAPGHKNLFEAPIAGNNLLRAHGKAVEVYRAIGRHEVGIAINLEPKYPASQSHLDLEATRRADGYMNRQFLDPLLLGYWPPEMSEIFGEAWIEETAEDLQQIRQPIDFLGLNYYTRAVVRHDEKALPVKAAPVRQERATYTETGWEVCPPGLLRPAALGQGALRPPADRHHRKRRRLLRPAGGRRRAGRRPAAGGLLPGAPEGGAPGDRSRRAGRRATAPGRCSITSNGASATPNASASSTSTTAPSSAPGKKRPLLQLGDRQPAARCSGSSGGGCRIEGKGIMRGGEL